MITLLSLPAPSTARHFKVGTTVVPAFPLRGRSGYRTLYGGEDGFAEGFLTTVTALLRHHPYFVPLLLYLTQDRPPLELPPGEFHRGSVAGSR